MRALIERWIRERRHVLIYGEAATGKTHLAYQFFLEAARAGLEPVMLATEPGTITFLSHIGAPYEPVMTMDSLASSVTEHALKGRYIIVDSLNWHYRENPGIEGARLLGYIASVLHETGGLSTAQVSADAQWPSGAPYIMPYAHVVARTSRGRRGFLLSLLKPVRRTGMFRLTSRGGVEWV